ncbi:MAG: hypothetical protein HYY09_06960, partial [Firmicutes bacterium]|nr:hypothetical protein [Bacillota bacterium]
RDAASFQAKVRSLLDGVRRTVETGLPTLVAFPEDVGTPCFLCGTGVVRPEEEDSVPLDRVIARLARKHLPKVLMTRIRHRVGWVRALMLVRARETARVYFDVFRGAARDYGYYIAAGSACLPEWVIPSPDPCRVGSGHQGSYRQESSLRSPDPAAVYNIAFLFGPDGRLAGWQKKVNLLDLEGPGGLDLSPGTLEELRVIDTSAGRLGTAVCLDAFELPVRRRLLELGARILVQPSANPKAWTAEQQEDWLRGAHNAVRGELSSPDRSSAPAGSRGSTAEAGKGWDGSNGEGTLTAGTGVLDRFAYAVNPMMVGSLFGLGFEGQSAVIWDDGWAVAGDPLGEEIVTAMLPFPR